MTSLWSCAASPCRVSSTSPLALRNIFHFAFWRQVVGYASLPGSEWPLLLFSQPRQICHFPAKFPCAHHLYNKLFMCFTANSGTAVGPCAAFVPPSLSDVGRHPYSIRSEQPKGCPVCWQSLASWKGLKNSHNPPIFKAIDALLGPNESLLSWNSIYTMLAW